MEGQKVQRRPGRALRQADQLLLVWWARSGGGWDNCSSCKSKFTNHELVLLYRSL